MTRTIPTVAICGQVGQLFGDGWFRLKFPLFFRYFSNTSPCGSKRSQSESPVANARQVLGCPQRTGSALPSTNHEQHTRRIALGPKPANLRLPKLPKNGNSERGWDSLSGQHVKDTQSRRSRAKGQLSARGYATKWTGSVFQSSSLCDFNSNLGSRQLSDLWMVMSHFLHVVGSAERLNHCLEKPHKSWWRIGCNEPFFGQIIL